ncbi:Putative uncharacterized protein [Moritella viscosa]|nr:Putative uncharacterized protein [Moritella viscosa]
MMVLSSELPLCIPATVPMGTPIKIDNMKALKQSSNVAGNTVNISSKTG